MKNRAYLMTTALRSRNGVPLLIAGCLAALAVSFNYIACGGSSSSSSGSSGGTGAKSVSITGDNLYKCVEKNEVATYYIKIHNDSDGDHKIKITGTPASANWAMTYYDPITGTDITSQITAAGYQTPDITPTGFYTIQVAATPVSVTPGAILDADMRAWISDDPAVTASGKATTHRIITPTVVGTYNVSITSTDVFVAGNYAYIPAVGSVEILDISDPTSPTLVGSYSGSANKVYVSGNYAYVTDMGASLNVVDVSDPAAPTLSGTYTCSAFDVCVSGTYAYVTDAGAGLQVIDVSDPTSPTLTGSYFNGALSAFQYIFLAGNYAYVTADNDLYILNCSNPASPTLTGSCTISSTGGNYSVWVSGDYAYVAGSDAGMPIINISNPASPTLVNTYDPSPSDGYYYISNIAYAQDVYVVSDYAYLVCQNSLHIIGVADPTAPPFGGVFNMPGYIGAKFICVSGNYAYVVGDGQMKVVRLTD